MSRMTPLFMGAVAGFWAVTPAFAQVTPEEVWGNWKTLAESSGVSVSAASESRVGDTLTLVDVTVKSDQNGARITAPMGTVLMRAGSGGTVEVMMSPEYTMDISIDEQDSDPVEMALSVAHTGAKIVASGTLDNLTYAASAESIAISLDALSVKGEEMPLGVEISMTGVASTSTTSGQDIRDQTADLTIAELAIAVDAEDPEGDGTMTFSMASEALAMRYAGTMIPGMAGPDMAKALRDGLMVQGSYAIGPTSFDFDFADKAETAKGQGNIASTALDFNLSKDALSYTSSAVGVDVTASGSQIPFPELKFSLGEYALGLTMPVIKSDVPSDFRVLLRLVDLVLPPEIWAMGDPTGTLTQGPATVVLDAKGKARMLVDIMDPAATSGEEIPGEIEALDITELKLSAVGAELTGTGAFTFDNADKTTFPGMPAPDGSADFKLVGGNGLLDNLIAMGVIPQEQAMGMRMMMGLFGRVGTDPDTLTSKIEVKSDGTILANGQRIQ
ncbi:MAG: DUF2125 domain-containing protein [Gemmobacter sp.]|nr:DUF2125 domain-containing protein [Gemmobacter sp.]